MLRPQEPLTVFNLEHIGTTPLGVDYFSGDVTVKTAKRLLSQNDKNRPCSPATWKAMVWDIKHGKYRANLDPIVISPDGQLVNGQHRCTAVVKSGVTITAIFIVGDWNTYDRFYQNLPKC